MCIFWRALILQSVPSLTSWHRPLVFLLACLTSSVTPPPSLRWPLASTPICPSPWSTRRSTWPTTLWPGSTSASGSAACRPSRCRTWRATGTPCVAASWTCGQCPPLRMGRERWQLGGWTPLAHMFCVCVRPHPSPPPHHPHGTSRLHPTSPIRAARSGEKLTLQLAWTILRFHKQMVSWVYLLEQHTEYVSVMWLHTETDWSSLCYWHR